MKVILDNILDFSEERIRKLLLSSPLLNKNEFLKSQETCPSIIVTGFAPYLKSDYEASLNKVKNPFFLRKEHKYKYQFSSPDLLLEKIISTSTKYISFVFPRGTRKISMLKIAFAQRSIIIKDIFSDPSQYIVIFEKLNLSCCEVDSLRDFCNNSPEISSSNPPVLSDFYLKNCKLLSHRARIFEKIPKNLVGCELGVARGDFSKEILKNCTPTQLILIDRETEYVEKELSGYKNVIIKKGSTTSILKQFKDGYFDFIYIDADHSYEGCKLDLELSLKKMTKNGFLIADDYFDFEGYDLKGNHLTRYKSFGVTKAVNELCIKHNLEIIYYSLGPKYSRNVCLKRIT